MRVRGRVSNVAIVGSNSFPLDLVVGEEIVNIMKEYGDEVTFHVRARPSFDRFVARAAETLGRTVILYPSRGGADNFERDVRLVAAVDEVVAFLDPNHLDAGEETGTMHVVAKALDRKLPVRAYSCWESRLVYAGAS